MLKLLNFIKVNWLYTQIICKEIFVFMYQTLFKHMEMGEFGRHHGQV